MILNSTEMVDRLIRCGFTEQEANETIQKYAGDWDFSGLEAFIRGHELFLDDRREYV